MLSKASALSHGSVLSVALLNLPLQANKANQIFSAVLLSTTITSVTYERSSLLGKVKWPIHMLRKG